MSVVDREALKTAVADADDLMDGSEVDSLHDLIAAARSVLDGEAIWICDVHKAESVHQNGIDPPPYCWVSYYLHQASTSGEVCSMVRVVVVPIGGTDV